MIFTLSENVPILLAYTHWHWISHFRKWSATL